MAKIAEVLKHPFWKSGAYTEDLSKFLKVDKVGDRLL